MRTAMKSVKKAAGPYLHTCGDKEISKSEGSGLLT